MMNTVDIKYLRDAIEESTYKLKSKEISLIKSMKKCIEEKKYATTGQADFLQSIYCRSQGRGDYQNRERS